MGNFAPPALSPRAVEAARAAGVLAVVSLALRPFLFPIWFQLLELAVVVLLLWVAGPRRCLLVLAGRTPDSSLRLPLAAAALAVATSIPAQFGYSYNWSALAAGMLALHMYALRALQEVTEESSENAPQPPQAPPISAFTAELVPILNGGIVACVLLAALAVAFLPGHFMFYRTREPLPPHLVYHHVVMVALGLLMLDNPRALRRAGEAAFEVAPKAAERLRVHYSNVITLDLMRRCTILCLRVRGVISANAPEEGLRVSDVEPVSGVSFKELLAIAAAAEAAAVHPIAEAIRLRARHEYAKALTAEEAWEAEWGAGAQVEGEAMVAGRPEFVRDLGVDIDPLEHAVYRLQQQGKSALIVARANRPQGVLGVHAPLRPESVRVFKLLRRMNVQTVLLSGDSPGTVSIIREQAGAERAHAGINSAKFPDLIAQEKSATIGTVCLVTDGQPPPGNRADVEFTFGALADDGEHERRVWVEDNELKLLPRALLLARAVHTNAVQSIWFVMGYHVLFVPLAMTGFMHPALALLLAAACGSHVEGHARRLMKFDMERRVQLVLKQRRRF